MIEDYEIEIVKRTKRLSFSVSDKSSGRLIFSGSVRHDRNVTVSHQNDNSAQMRLPDYIGAINKIRNEAEYLF